MWKAEYDRYDSGGEVRRGAVCKVCRLWDSMRELRAARIVSEGSRVGDTGEDDELMAA